tara:strand:+ start:40543 stop:40677 length:135 start_codon:yes stop_codon:yes gene_type:complete
MNFHSLDQGYIPYDQEKTTIVLFSTFPQRGKRIKVMFYYPYNNN